MNYSNWEILKIITPFLKDKCKELTLAIRIELIKTNKYEEFFTNLCVYVKNQIKDFIIQKISDIDQNDIANKMNVLFDQYLKSLKTKRRIIG